MNKDTYKRLTERRGSLVIDKCGNCPNVNNPQGCTVKNCYEIMKNRLAELEDKIENGTLVELPCKVGDTVWFLDMYAGKPLGTILSDKIQVVGISSRGFHLKLRNYHDHNKTYYFGKTAFLIKAEAEAKLKELQEGKK